MEITKSHAREILSRVETLIAMQRMKKKDFYESSGISSSLYSQYNTGKIALQLSAIVKMAEALNVTPDYLIGIAPVENTEVALQAAFFDGYADDLTQEQKDGLWRDAQDFARFRAEQLRKEKHRKND